MSPPRSKTAPVSAVRTKSHPPVVQANRAERTSDVAPLLQLQSTVGNRRVASDLRPSGADLTKDGVRGESQQFSFGEDEMARRLEAMIGGEHPATKSQPRSRIFSKLDQAQRRVEQDNQKQKEIGKAPEQEKDKPLEEPLETRSSEDASGERGVAEPAPTPGPASELEGLIASAANAYLDGADTGDKIAPLTATTLRLLEGARVLAEAPVVEPEPSVLGRLTGVSALIDAFTRGSQGYEQEEPWLRTVAQIREIASTLGGVVGMIGLVTTVSGAILSLLVAPVGAFLLTVGSFCDTAAVVLDVVSGVLSAFLTGYNLYRLKNETDPVEKRRLFELVRSDAMSTLMSGFALATAAAPGVGRAIGRTKVGRLAGIKLARLGGKLGKGLAKVPGASVARSARNATVGTFHRVAEGVRNTSVIQTLNKRAVVLEERMLAHLANRPRVVAAYKQNRGLADVVQEGSVRGYHVDRGRQIHMSLGSLERQGLTIDQIEAKLKQRYGVPFKLRRRPKTGRIHFSREDSNFLARMRQTELDEIKRIRAANPAASSAELTTLVHNSPEIRGRYTAEELDALAAGEFKNLPKTPHHTIPVQVAPHLAQDPRFIQMANEPRFYDKFVHKVFPGHTPVFTIKDLKKLLKSGEISGFNRSDYFLGPNNKAFIRELQRSGGTGEWINPFDSGQKFIFNAHGVIGHNWNYADDSVIRTIFGEYAQRQGEPTQRILGSTARSAARIVPPIVSQGPELVAGAPQSEVDASTQEAAPPLAVAGMAVSPSGSLAFLSSLRARATRGIVAFSTPKLGGTARLESSVGGRGPVSLATTATSVDRAESPPEKVDYSPRSLAEIVGQKAEVAEAITALEALVLTARGIQQDNHTIEQRASNLAARDAARRRIIEGEQADITVQDGKLDRAAGAQRKMSVEGARASSESKRGQDQARSVEAQGNATTVEARPEEPEQRGWLERAWDATGGALWSELVAPAIDLVQRKVGEVMESINQFIMGLIEQALGLDEIKAQIDAGGTDIADRGASLDETRGGLDQTCAQTEEAEETNLSTIEQARANAVEAATVEEEAAQMLPALREHHAALASEEATTRGYVAAFGERYAAFFDPRQVDGDPGREASLEWAETEAKTRSQDPDAASREVVTEAHVATVMGWIADTRRGDEAALAELTQLATESSAAVAEHLRDEERASASASLGTFRESRLERAARLRTLLDEVRRCVGLPIDSGAARLEVVAGRVFDIAQEVESARGLALSMIGAVHERADATTLEATTLNAPFEPEERV